MSGNYFALLGDDGDVASTPVVQEKETQQAKPTKPSQPQTRAKQSPKGKGQVEQSRNNNQGRNNQNKFRSNNSAHNETHDNGSLTNPKKIAEDKKKKVGAAGSARRFHGNSRGRTYDRSSHSTAKGMLNEKKGGAGKSNWGTQPDAEKAYEEDATKIGEQPESVVDSNEEELEKSVTFDEYTKDRDVAVKAQPQRKAGEGVDNSEWEKTGATQYKKEDLVESNNKTVQKKKKKNPKKDVIPFTDVLTVHTEPRGDKRNKKFGDRKKNEPRNNNNNNNNNNKRAAPTTLQVDDNAFPVLKSGSS